MIVEEILKNTSERITYLSKLEEILPMKEKFEKKYEAACKLGSTIVGFAAGYLVIALAFRGIAIKANNTDYLVCYARQGQQYSYVSNELNVRPANYYFDSLQEMLMQEIWTEKECNDLAKGLVANDMNVFMDTSKIETHQMEPNKEEGFEVGSLVIDPKIGYIDDSAFFITGDDKKNLYVWNFKNSKVFHNNNIQDRTFDVHTKGDTLYAAFSAMSSGNDSCEARVLKITKDKEGFDCLINTLYCSDKKLSTPTYHKTTDSYIIADEDGQVISIQERAEVTRMALKIEDFDPSKQVYQPFFISRNQENRKIEDLIISSDKNITLFRNFRKAGGTLFEEQIRISEPGELISYPPQCLIEGAGDPIIVYGSESHMKLYNPRTNGTTRFDTPLSHRIMNDRKDAISIFENGAYLVWDDGKIYRHSSLDRSTYFSINSDQTDLTTNLFAWGTLDSSRQKIPVYQEMMMFGAGSRLSIVNNYALVTYTTNNELEGNSIIPVYSQKNKNEVNGIVIQGKSKVVYLSQELVNYFSKRSK